MGRGMRLSYREPIRVASAEGVWITDTDGVRYLDAYNNVPHVGHGRPEVVEAIATQAARLNTNTRYLVDGVTAYAERLASLLPDPLEIVLFANSGSEANDLAWRMAHTVTGNSGAIVTANAYHGSTALTMATSPEELGLDRLEPRVATIPIPDGFDEGAVEAAARSLEAAGHPPAFLAVDTIFSSDGIYDAGQSLSGLTAAVRDAGGLFIADEVQAGFGRVGGRMWGFASSNVVPDIVTLGKPIGNGHPLAAVITTAAIAEAFFARGYYFSTFAGNPVSAAAGSAVLDVMDAEELAAAADRVGTALREAIHQIGHPAMSSVRGAGLFIGVELGDSQGEPDATLADDVVNAMRDRQVLIGRTGLHRNVLKIRPPLVFTDEHAARVAAVVAEVLAARTR